MRWTILVGFVWLSSGGCGDPPGIGPGSQIEVTNLTDSFHIQILGLTNATDTLAYEWQNTGTQATVDISQGLSGSVILTVRDNAGTVVHQADVVDDNDTDTGAGVAGTWSIELHFLDASGFFALDVTRT